MINILFLVLCSGTLRFSLAANRLRSFKFLEHCNNIQKEGCRFNWTKSQQYCGEEGGSLLSLYDEEDAKIIRHFLNCTSICTTWLGLRKDDNYTLTWSNGTEATFNRSVDLNNEEILCVAFENRQWNSFNCSEEKTFMCQKDGNYTFLNTTKNWCQAMQHCRTHYDDLASIFTEYQNEELSNQSLGKSFWIGLQHDKWKWTDNSCSTYRVKLKYKLDFDCCSVNRNQMNSYGCENVAYAICSKGTVKIQVIMESKTWEEALEYCTAKDSRLLWIENKEDQDALEMWLKITNSTGRFWIGLRQSSTFGFWIWSDRIVHYQNWKNVSHFSHHCGVIDAGTYKWSDENCWSKLPFLCEEDIVYFSK